MKFKLTDEQSAKVADWQEKHKRSCAGAIGGIYTYSFTVTGLGVVTVVTNNLTKETLDISDYDNW